MKQHGCQMPKKDINRTSAQNQHFFHDFVGHLLKINYLKEYKSCYSMEKWRKVVTITTTTTSTTTTTTTTTTGSKFGNLTIVTFSAVMVTSQLLLVEETGGPGANHHLLPFSMSLAAFPLTPGRTQTCNHESGSFAWTEVKQCPAQEANIELLGHGQTTGINEFSYMKRQLMNDEVSNCDIFNYVIKVKFRLHFIAIVLQKKYR